MSRDLELGTLAELMAEAGNLLAADFDVSPAARFTIEALLTEALNNGAAPERLRAMCPANIDLGVCEREGREVVWITMWQLRAPVGPSISP
jgi:hypothetical protein